MKSKRILTFILLMLIVGLFSNLSLAGDKIKLKLHQPPPNKLGPGNLWKLDVTNLTKSPIAVYLVGTATEEKDGLIARGETKPFEVKPGKSTYGYDDFKNGNVSWENKKYEEPIIRTGNVPDGTYEICVTAYFENGQIADNEQCVTQIINNGTTGLITLISPTDGEEFLTGGGVDEEQMKDLNFVWTGTGLKGPYTLQIFEIKKGQTPEQAFKENRMFFEKDKIANTSFQYPLTGPKFEKEKKYAWLVKAGSITSEVWTFQLLTAQPDYCYNVRFSLQQVPGSPGCFNVIANVNQAIFWTSVKLASTSAIFSSYSNVLNGWNAGSAPGTPPFTVLEFSKGSSGSALPLGITTVAQFCVNVTEPATFHLFYSADGIPPCDTTLTVNHQLDTCRIRGYKYIDKVINNNSMDPGEGRYGWTIRLYNMSGSPTTMAAVTNMLGYFEILNVPCNSGPYILREEPTPTQLLLYTVDDPPLTTGYTNVYPSSGPWYFRNDTISRVPDTCTCTGDWNSKYNVDYTNSQGNSGHYSGSCDNFSNTPFEVRRNTNLTFTAYTGYNCLPSNPPCLEYRWKVIESGSSVVHNQGTSTTPMVTFPANLPGSPPNYTFLIYAYCGQQLCDSCGFNFTVKDSIQDSCRCDVWEYFRRKINENTPSIQISNNQTISVRVGESVAFNYKFKCTPIGFQPIYNWYLYKLQDNSIVDYGHGNNPTLNISESGNYKFEVTPFCCGNQCLTYTIYIKVDECSCPPNGYIRIRKADNSFWPGNYSCNSKFYFSNINDIKQITFFPSPCPTGCTGSLNWTVKKYKWNDVQIGSDNTGNNMTILNFPFALTWFQYYKVIFKQKCGNINCPPCTLTIKKKLFFPDIDAEKQFISIAKENNINIEDNIVNYDKDDNMLMVSAIKGIDKYSLKDLFSGKELIFFYASLSSGKEGFYKIKFTSNQEMKGGIVEIFDLDNNTIGSTEVTLEENNKNASSGGIKITLEENPGGPCSINLSWLDKDTKKPILILLPINF